MITFVALASFCGLLVSVSNLMSRDKIVENQIRFEQKQLIEIANDTKVELLEIAPDVHQLSSGGEITGYVFKQSTDKGYNGNITFWLGVDTWGEVLGVRIISHKETPGLGDKIETGVSDWIHSFVGKSLENTKEAKWTVKKDGGVFDQFSGATITARAVVEGVKTGLERFENKSTVWVTTTESAINVPPETTQRGEKDGH